VSVNGKVATLGVTDYAQVCSYSPSSPSHLDQKSLGEVTFIEFPEVGADLAASGVSDSPVWDMCVRVRMEL
jgi:glycine cleavage system H lipoate-binding protein